MTLGYPRSGTVLVFKLRSRSQGGLMLSQEMPNIFQTGRPTKFKLGIQTEHEDLYQRQAPWPPRSRDTSDRCWQISREWNFQEAPKLVRRLPTPWATSLLVSRSKVWVTWSITLHSNTSFQTTIMFYSHSLGGDTDKSNTCLLYTSPSPRD